MRWLKPKLGHNCWCTSAHFTPRRTLPLSLSLLRLHCPRPYKKQTILPFHFFTGKRISSRYKRSVTLSEKKPSLLQPNRDPHRLPSVRARLEEQIGQVDFRVARSATRSASAPQICGKDFLASLFKDKALCAKSEEATAHARPSRGPAAIIYIILTPVCVSNRSTSFSKLRDVAAELIMTNKRT